jgi:hypothetical protein
MSPWLAQVADVEGNPAHGHRYRFVDGFKFASGGAAIESL